MGPGEYVFRALSDRAARLPKVEAWVENRPLSAREVNRLLKKYARRAGLDEGRVHVHLLRHSAAMLEKEMGTGLSGISRFLGHEDPKTTTRYVRHLRGEEDGTWDGMVRKLGVGSGSCGQSGLEVQSGGQTGLVACGCGDCFTGCAGSLRLRSGQAQ